MKLLFVGLALVLCIGVGELTRAEVNLALRRRTPWELGGLQGPFQPNPFRDGAIVGLWMKVTVGPYGDPNLWGHHCLPIGTTDPNLCRIGLRTLCICFFFLPAVEALQCKVCKYKIPYVGCFHGANETTCERRERCAIIKTSLGRKWGQNPLFHCGFLAQWIPKSTIFNS